MSSPTLAAGLVLALALTACASAPTADEPRCETWYQRCFVDGIEPGYCIPSWYSENCGQDVTTYIRAECEARGGTPIGCETMTGVHCSMPTSDAGTPCTSSTACEAECVASDDCEIDAPATGTCAARTGLSCSGVRTVEDGRCGAMTVA